MPVEMPALDEAQQEEEEEAASPVRAKPVRRTRCWIGVKRLWVYGWHRAILGSWHVSTLPQGERPRSHRGVLG